MLRVPMVFATAGMLLALGGCGSTDTTRATTGGVGGAVAGAVVGGPVGAVVGGAGGAATGMAMDEGAEEKAQRLTGLGDDSSTRSGSTNARSSDRSASGGSAQALSPQRVRTIQQALNDQGSSIDVDGVWGPDTRRALRDFQQSKGLSATGRLDRDTVAALNLSDRQDDAGQSGSSGQPNRP
ncbi:MAG TPA: peptidoglycan-binding domain-containing protein [Azospirillum sp.]|nr:peptidoglycan-binding domain-containing protein [Azospirillum sp.]